jgi:hypothetical protein
MQFLFSRFMGQKLFILTLKKEASICIWICAQITDQAFVNSKNSRSLMWFGMHIKLQVGHCLHLLHTIPL